MFDASDRTAKKKIEVEVEFDDGKCLTGSLYIHPQGRLIDMLNDERLFFPFEKSDGTFIALKKSSFRSVTELNPED